jgi:hypothetical protein
MFLDQVDAILKNLNLKRYISPPSLTFLHVHAFVALN